MKRPTPRLQVTAALGLLLLLHASWGPGSNDEMDQASAYHNLSQGSLEVHDVDHSLYTVDYNGHEVAFKPRYEGPTPVGSTMLNVLALPLASFGPYVALGLTNMALYVATAWLLWPTIRGRVPTNGAAAILVAATMLGPLMHWGQAVKYHALGAFLVTAALHLQTRQGLPARLATGIVAGLAIWNHVGIGTTLAAGLAFAELRHAWRNRDAIGLASRWLPIVIGGVLALTPFLLENAALNGHPLQDGHAATAEGDGSAAPSLSLFGTFASVIQWTGAGDFLANLASGYVWSRAEGNPIPVLWASPLLAAGLAFVPLWLLRRRAIDDSSALAVGVLAAHTVLYTNLATAQGFGADMRFYSHILPTLGVLAAAAVGPALARLDARAVLLGAAGAAGALVLATGLPSHLGLRGYYFAFASIGLATLGALWLLGRIGWIDERGATAALVAGCLALPALWGAYFILGDPSGDMVAGFSLEEWLPAPPAAPLHRA